MLSVLLSTTIRVITEVKICCGLTRLRLVSPQHFDYCDDAYSLSIRVQTTLNHIRFVKQTVLNHIRFVFYHNVKVKKMFFFRARAEKGIAWHIEQRCQDSYRQRQISQSDCEINRNCGKIVFYYDINNEENISKERKLKKALRDTLTQAGLSGWTNRFHVAVRLFSNRSQMTSKCGKNKKVGYEAIAECVTDVVFFSIKLSSWIAVFVHFLAGQGSSEVACNGISRARSLYQPKWCVSFGLNPYILSLNSF